MSANFFLHNHDEADVSARGHQFIELTQKVEPVRKGVSLSLPSEYTSTFVVMISLNGGQMKEASWLS